MDLQIQNSQMNPIESDRHFTDKLFIIIFLSIFVLWAAIAVSASFSNERINDSKEFIIFKRAVQQDKLRINAPWKKSSWALIISLLVTILVINIYIYLVKKSPKFWIWYALINYLWLIIMDAFNLFHDVSLEREADRNLIKQIMKLILNIIFTIVGSAGLHKVGVVVPQKIIKYTFQIINKSFSLMLFAGFIIILKYAVFVITMNAVLDYLVSDHNKFLISLLSIIIIICAVNVLLFIFFLAIMAISEYVVTSYWENNRNLLIGRNNFRILRYHIGTVMFSSTIFISWISSIVESLKFKLTWERQENLFLHYASNVFLAVFMPIDALIYSTIYGAGLVKSSQNTLNEILSHGSLYLAGTWIIVTLVYINMIAFVNLGGIIATIIVVKGFPVGKCMLEENQLQYYLIVYGIYYFLAIFHLSIYICVKALLFNEIIILNKKD